MFITKDELKNTLLLIRVKLSGMKSGTLLAGIGIICAIFLISPISLIIRMSAETDWVEPYKLLDYSLVFMIGLWAVITFKNSRYRQINKDTDVYPQTGVSRFLSTHAIFFIWIVFAALLYTLLYLVEYGMIAALAAFRGNIRLIYKFDIGFVLAGFVVMIIYTSVIASAAALIAALIRKFRFYAVGFFVLVFGLMYADKQPLINFCGPVIKFLIIEDGLINFIIKGAGLCLALLMLTFIVDKYTAYYRDAARIIKISFTVITPACVLAMLYIGYYYINPYYFQNFNDPDSDRILYFNKRDVPRDKLSDTEQLNMRNDWKDYRGHGEITLDASAVPKGSKIIVNDINQPKACLDKSYCNGRFKLTYDEDELSDFDGDKLLISYIFPDAYYDMQQHRLTPFANMRVSASLEDTTLHIDYAYDKNIKAVLLSVWPFMQQFYYYKDKDVITGYYLFLTPLISGETPMLLDGNVSIKVLPEARHEREEREQFERRREQIMAGIYDEMVFVGGGTFTMGCTPEQGSDCRDIGKPSHRVSLNNFYIGKYEVTQEQWKAVMGYDSNLSFFKGDDLPVERVDWVDVHEFISKLNAATGKNYRLPTEAEWEYAARGGNKSNGYKYSGGDDFDEVAWHIGNSMKMTHSVGTKKANELGIYDMSGNVGEWVNDRYGNYTSETQTNPQGPSTGRSRVIRGGSWWENNPALELLVSFRGANEPWIRFSVFGFRLALDSK